MYRTICYIGKIYIDRRFIEKCFISIFLSYVTIKYFVQGFVGNFVIMEVILLMEKTT